MRACVRVLAASSCRALTRVGGELLAYPPHTPKNNKHHHRQMAITAIRELKVLQKLKHKNIVAFKEVVTEGASCCPRPYH